jgi:hypothetical protein
MERRGCGLGCVVTLLGLALSCCLLPYLVSSVYSVVSAVLQVEGTPGWLWGDWLSSTFGADGALYMILAEGPICCVGVLGLLIVVLGAVMLIGGSGPEEPDYDDEEYEDDEADYDDEYASEEEWFD